MIKLNKKAGEKIFSLWWFFSIVLVSVAVITMTLNFFNAPIDTRNIEVSKLHEKIARCVIDKGYLRENINSEIDLLEFCSLNPNAINEDSEYLINVKIYNENQELFKSWQYGRIDYKQDCEISINLEASNYLLCINNSESILFYNTQTNQKEHWALEILVATNNLGSKGKTKIEEETKDEN